MKIIPFSLMLAFVGLSNLNAQTHQLFLKPGPADGKDAYIHDLNINQNLGYHADYTAMAWTCSGTPCISRSLIDFDWKLIPAGATITSAKLKLFINPTSTNGTPSSGANTASLQRITSPWEEMLVTWNNQPTVTQTNKIQVGPSALTSGNYDLNVTQLVVDMVNNPATSFGFRISLNTEVHYRRLLFSSSDNLDCALHPELLVEYTLAGGTQPISHLSLQPDAATGKDAYIHDINPTENIGTSNEIPAIAWTCGGTPCVARGLLDFDLTSIPLNTEIIEATLYLSQNPTSANGAHAGTNASVIKRITSTWDEQTVNWTSAPSTTSFNQVSLNTSSSENQAYAVNVTGLIQDYVDNPSNSFGMMLSLLDETPLRRMTFASSDHSNCALRPKLDISYRPSTLSVEKVKADELINIFPNPTAGIVNIETKENGTYSLIGAEGRTIATGVTTKDTEFTIDLSALNSGMYFLQIKFEGNNMAVKKIIKD